MNKYSTMLIAALAGIGVILWFLSIRVVSMALLWLLIGVPRLVVTGELYEKEKTAAMPELGQLTGRKQAACT